MIDINGYKDVDILNIECDNCKIIFNRSVKNVKVSRKKWNKDVCKVCSLKLSVYKKPQCSKAFWENLDKKIKHSNSIKESIKYNTGILNRKKIFGDKNPMYGKKHKSETIEKMSKVRRGKIGENATAWKGGKNSVSRRIKTYQYRNGWYNIIYIRDKYKCVKCFSNKNIEIHHITPIKNIVDLYRSHFIDDDSLYRHIISLNIINDTNNGVALCRDCHKKEHKNFGSHFPKK